MSCCIFISDIASFIGKSNYDIVTPFQRLWKKCDLIGYNKALNNLKNELANKQLEIASLTADYEKLDNDLQNKKITKRQHAIGLKKLDEQKTEITRDCQKVEQKVDLIALTQQEILQKTIGSSIVEEIKDATIETDDKRSKVIAVIDSLDLSQEQKKQVVKDAQSFINKSHGTLKEDSALDMYEKKYSVVLDKSQEYHKKQLKATKKTWYIGGKMDGLYIDQENHKNSYIVEVKNRTRGFFSSIRDYELTQIQMYLWVTGLNKAKLVEKYENKIRITDIYRDDKFIDEVLECLDTFTNEFEKFLEDSQLQTKYMSLDQESKKTFIYKLYLAKIQERLEEMVSQEELSCDISTESQ